MWDSEVPTAVICKVENRGSRFLGNVGRAYLSTRPHGVTSQEIITEVEYFLKIFVLLTTKSLGWYFCHLRKFAELLYFYTDNVKSRSTVSSNGMMYTPNSIISGHYDAIKIKLWLSVTYDLQQTPNLKRNIYFFAYNKYNDNNGHRDLN
jgi:hypothetical protein